MSAPAVSGIVAALEHAFPAQWAEPWDRVGLLAGDGARPVEGVTLALDATAGSLKAARAVGSNVLVTHHPAFLTPPERLVPGSGPSGVLFSAAASGIALVNAHTNLDRAPRAARLLPERLGLTPLAPIETGLQPMTMVSVFVPATHAETVAAAMRGAGAGRIGQYEGARFTSAPGVGSFEPLAGATPYTGVEGEPASAAEVRLEMVAAPSASRSVAMAAREAHPYEEPLITVAAVEIARAGASLGMLSEAPPDTTVASLAGKARRAFGAVPRVWGRPEKPVRTVATATGSAGSLLADVRRCRADVLVAGEVRYHEALSAVDAGVSIIELGHDVSEWPLVTLLEEVVLGVEGIDPEKVHVLPATPGWWVPQD